MKGRKILNKWASLPLTQRFYIAADLGLSKKGLTIDEIDPQERDKVSFSFLNRAKEMGVIDKLYDRLFPN